MNRGMPIHCGSYEQRSRQTNTHGTRARWPHLFMGKTQLVLEDSLSIGQDLDLVGESVECIRQGESKTDLVHAQLAKTGMGMTWEGRGKRKEEESRQRRRAVERFEEKAKG